MAILLSKFTNKITEVVSGTANGADSLGEQWAQKNGIPVQRFPADWKSLGNSAGYIRNKTMSVYCDGAIGLWDGESKGTKHMIKLIRDSKKPFFINVVL